MADALSDIDSPEPYYGSDWASLRAMYQERRYWYKGDEWKKEMEGRDSQGERDLRWPLQLNPIAKACRIHRAVMLGMVPDRVDKTPVVTLVNRLFLEDADRPNAEIADRFLARVWADSHGPANQCEANLLTQYYGGHVYQVTWEPWQRNLHWRIGIRSYATPEVFYPVAFDPTTYELLEAYIGYEIPPAYAEKYYGIKVPENRDKVLYLEHWSRENYEVTVGGQVPNAKTEDGKKHVYAGDNAWGVVPIVYQPHERDGEFWGRSLIDSDSVLIGLAKEWNARLADKGDDVQQSAPIVWARNARTASWVVNPVRINNRTVIDVVDLGHGQPLGTGQEPELNIVQSQGMSPTSAKFVEELQDLFRQQADVAAVAFGDDDVSGGRITGPVTAYRMWPTMMHSMAERLFANEAMCRLAQIVAAIGLERKKSGKYEAWGVRPPELDAWVREFSYCTQWLPMIPIEEKQTVEMLTERLRESGISLETYVSELGTQDPRQETERIWEDREREAELKAKSNINPMFGGGPPQGNVGGSNERG